MAPDRCVPRTFLKRPNSKSGELAQAFSGRPDFKEIIGYDAGFCWLKAN